MSDVDAKRIEGGGGLILDIARKLLLRLDTTVRKKPEVGKFLPG